MDAEKFILQAGYDDLDEARRALREDPTLASTRNGAGVSVIAATVYAGRLEFAQEIAATRDDLDLFEAACVGDVARVIEILDRGPDAIDRQAPDGFSALGFAAFFGHQPLLELLLARGASFETPSDNAMRVRPLHSAVAHHDQARAIELARALLRAGADPNRRQEDGMTPLHEAVFNDNATLASLLLEHGADPSVENDEGVSPLGQAIADGKDALVERLRAGAGARAG